MAMANSEKVSWQPRRVLIATEFRERVARQSLKHGFTADVAMHVQNEAYQAVEYIDDVIRVMISQPKE
jgi:hypothetical protein